MSKSETPLRKRDIAAGIGLGALVLMAAASSSSSRSSVVRERDRFAYDALGRRRPVRFLDDDDDVVVEREYDSWGRLRSERVTRR